MQSAIQCIYIYYTNNNNNNNNNNNKIMLYCTLCINNVYIVLHVLAY